MDWLGELFEFERGNKEKALSYYFVAAELGWKDSMYSLARMLSVGQGRAKDLRRAVVWSARSDNARAFWDILEEAKGVFGTIATKDDLDCDFNQALLFARLGIVLVSAWKDELESGNS